MNIGYSYPLLRIFGITINIDFSWLFAFILVVFSLAQGFFPHMYPGLVWYQYWLAGTVSALFLFISVLLHELAHSLVAIKSGIPVKDIYLFIFGGVAMIEKEPKSASVEFRVAVAGPLMSFFLASLFLMFAYLYPYDDLFNGFLNYMFMVNLSLGLFNLVPAFPLDGGRILRSILWPKKGLLKATKIAAGFGNYFGILLIIAGVLSAISGALINGLWLIFLGVFIRRASKQAYISTKISSILSRYRVDNFLTTMNPILHSEPVETYLNLYHPFYRTNIYPVLSQDGKIRFIYYPELKKLPFYEVEGKTVGDFQTDFRYAVDPSDSLVDAYRLMLKNNLSEVPAVYNDTFVGILKKDIIDTILNQYMREMDEDPPGRRR